MTNFQSVTAVSLKRKSKSFSELNSIEFGMCLWGIVEVDMINYGDSDSEICNKLETINFVSSIESAGESEEILEYFKFSAISVVYFVWRNQFPSNYFAYYLHSFAYRLVNI